MDTNLNCDNKGFDYEFVKTTLDVIGGKWKPSILWNIRQGPKRFNELMRNLDGVSHKVLTEHLRQLEEDRIIYRIVYEEQVKHVEYDFTEYGKTLCGIFKELENWGKQHTEKLNLV